MCVGRQISDLLPFQQLGIGAGSGNRQVEHFGDRCAHRSRIHFFVSIYDIIGYDPALFVGRSSQWDESRLAGHEVAYLYGIAKGIDVRGGSLHIFIDGNASQRSERQAGLFCQSGFRAYADAKQYHVGRNLFTATQVYGHTAILFLESADAILKMQADSFVCQLLVYDCCHREV